MNKKNIITIVGVALFTIGVVGTTWSGIESLTKLINKRQIAQNKENEKTILYNSEEKITKLNIDSTVSNVIIRKHDKSNVIVQRSGNKEISTITAKNNNNELIINEETKSTNKELKNIDDIVKQFIDNMYSTYNSDIIVYLPEKVNANIKTDYRGVIVEDDILLDNFNYETTSGYISLIGDLNLENLSIKSLSNVSLTTDEIRGIKNINVVANTVDIRDENYIGDDVNIPENINIKTTSTYYEDNSINIKSNTPVAKNMVIDSSSIVSLELPIVDYKFNFDINTSRGIKFEASDFDKYNNTFVEKYFEDEDTEDEKYLSKEFVGLINEDLKDNENEYIVNINSSYVVFE